MAPIAWQTLFRIGVALFAAWFLFAVRDVIAVFLAAFVVACAMDPAVRQMQRVRVPRSLSVLFLYATVAGTIGVLLTILTPLALQELDDVVHSAQALAQTFAQWMVTMGLARDAQNFYTSLSAVIADTGNALVAQTGHIVRSGVLFIAVFSLAFYISVSQGALREAIALLVVQSHRARVSRIVSRVRDTIGQWMGGQLLLMLAVFVLYWGFLTAIGVPHALLLALFGGFFEILPYVGPLIAAIPAIIAGFFVSPVVGATVIVGYWVIQQIENHVLVPQVMQRAVGINPIVVILAVLCGATLGGVAGLIFAVPIAIGAVVIVRELAGGVSPSDDND